MMMKVFTVRRHYAGEWLTHRINNEILVLDVHVSFVYPSDVLVSRCFKNNFFSSSAYHIKPQMFCIINSHCAKFQKIWSSLRVSQGRVSDFHYFLYKYLYSLTVEHSKMSVNRPISEKKSFRL